MDELSKSCDVKRFVSVALILCACVLATARIALADDEMNRKAIEYAYSIFAPEKLETDTAARYAARATTSTGEAVPDTTMRLFYIFQHWNSFDDATKAAVSVYVNPDALKSGGDGRVLPRVAEMKSETTYETTHFKIYYTIDTSDRNAVSSTDTNPSNGIPDYVDNVATALESVYALEITDLGFPAPPNESGQSKYRVMIWGLLNCAYTSEPEWVGDSCSTNSLLGFTMPLDDDYPFTSYLALDNTYSVYSSPVEGVTMTAAHEFMHAIQFGRYNGPDSSDDLWYFESQAVWIEDEILDDSNDYLYYLQGTSTTDCEYWFNCSNISLYNDSYSFRPYGSAILMKYLTEYKGVTSAVLDLQDYSVTTGDARTSLSTFASEKLGLNLTDMFLDFGVSLIDCTGYRDCDSYKPQNAYKKITASDGLLVNSSSYPAGKLSYNTFEITTSSVNKALTITAGTIDSNARLRILKCTSRRSSCTAVDVGTAIGNFGSTYPYVYVVAANGSSAINSLYSFTLSLTSRTAKTYTIPVTAQKWNLIFLPVPPNLDSGTVFDSKKSSRYLYSLPYVYWDDSNQAELGTLNAGNGVWAYPAEGATALSFSAYDEAKDSLTFELAVGEWGVVGNPSVTSEVPFDDDHVSIVKGATTYSLSDALSDKIVSAFYYYDPSDSAYKTLTNGTDSIEPWTACLVKSSEDVSITISQ